LDEQQTKHKNVVIPKLMLLKNIDGENVWTLTSILNGIMDQLSSNSLLPADAMTLVTNVLTQCSTMQKFVSFIEFMHHEHSIGSHRFSIDDCFDMS